VICYIILFLSALFFGTDNRAASIAQPLRFSRIETKDYISYIHDIGNGERRCVTHIKKSGKNFTCDKDYRGRIKYQVAYADTMFENLEIIYHAQRKETKTVRVK
jgi:hypothetical protein